MNIRVARNQDRDDIRTVYSSAFPEGESEIVAKLAIDLLSEDTTPQTISLIAETDNSVVGHVAFSPVRIHNDESFRAYILAPLAVLPDYQKRRIGSRLVQYGMQQLSGTGVNLLFVYGDPKYYGRFGFNADTARNYTAPYNLLYPFGWQAIVLNECDLARADGTMSCIASLCDPKLW